MKTTAMLEFERWLPAELDYSARKAGYDKKIARAKLPDSDRTSIYGFLGTEWHNFQLLHRQGKDHDPQGSMTAQLQLAKFAAGLFDKFGLGIWLKSGHSADEFSFRAAAEATAQIVLNERPWKFLLNANPDEILQTPFEETPFSHNVLDIMRGIARASDLPPGERDVTVKSFSDVAFISGGLAVCCYKAFAEANLSDNQLPIPISRLPITTLPDQLV